MVYNYAKIEAYVDKDSLKKSVEDMSYILSSVKFNDTLLKKMHEQVRLVLKKKHTSYLITKKRKVTS